MADLALIRALEERLINAWPAFEIEVVEGWILRFAEGYSKRANAATPLVPGAAVDPALIDHVLRSFEERAVAPCFRLTGVEDRRCEEVLAARGLVDFDPSLCLVAPLGPELAVDPSVVIRPAPKAAWIGAAAAAYGGEKANADRLGRIVRAIRQPAAFATLSLDGEDAGWGLAVCERGYVGLYDIVVAPNLRGLGLGRRLVVSLMAWGRDAGAAQAYLQMREANEVAGSLYASLGFTTAYRYAHRVLPAPP
ncbi:GNAT family N-acetyltransferase [Enterovirga aerilata]|uniref:GNAT family N-acetyltransferase n=1 Tax=Enterovirga aerilata TaxID=2730920 RepID=A0A849I156_9HYPH|nr:GNAT family N-acetyltransferase [Enterovirga sp. DB1703]NNM71111.1 GNAT family N-acetyltransferase [Enterovirga sp. DB1703]